MDNLTCSSRIGCDNTGCMHHEPHEVTGVCNLSICPLAGCLVKCQKVYACLLWLAGKGD